MAVKAREVRERLKTARDNDNWMEGVQYCLESVAEEIGVIQQVLINLAQAQDQFGDLLLAMTSVNEQMKNQMTALVKKKMGKDEPVIR